METVARIIPATEAGQVETLFRAAFTPYARRLGRELSPQSSQWLAAALAEQRIHGAYRADMLVGLAVTSRDEKGWTVEQLAVDPAQQGKGIGSFLLRHVEAEARREAAPSLFLHTAAMMTELVRLYERHGFREIRRGPSLHGLDQHPRVFMEKGLQPVAS